MSRAPENSGKGERRGEGGCARAAGAWRQASGTAHASVALSVAPARPAMGTAHAHGPPRSATRSAKGVLARVLQERAQGGGGARVGTDTPRHAAVPAHPRHHPPACQCHRLPTAPTVMYRKPSSSRWSAYTSAISAAVGGSTLRTNMKMAFSGDTCGGTQRRSRGALRVCRLLAELWLTRGGGTAGGWGQSARACHWPASGRTRRCPHGTVVGGTTWAALAHPGTITPLHYLKPHFSNDVVIKSAHPDALADDIHKLAHCEVGRHLRGVTGRDSRVMQAAISAAATAAAAEAAVAARQPGRPWLQAQRRAGRAARASQDSHSLGPPPPPSPDFRSARDPPDTSSCQCRGCHSALPSPQSPAVAV